MYLLFMICYDIDSLRGKDFLKIVIGGIINGKLLFNRNGQC